MQTTRAIASTGSPSLLMQATVPMRRSSSHGSCSIRHPQVMAPLATAMDRSSKPGVNFWRVNR